MDALLTLATVAAVLWLAKYKDRHERDWWGPIRVIVGLGYLVLFFIAVCGVLALLGAGLHEMGREVPPWAFTNQ
jgi:hypothetical protein